MVIEENFHFFMKHTRNQLALWTEHKRQLLEDPELRKAMGANARVIVQRYRRDIVMRQWTDLFFSVKGKELCV